MTTESSSGKRWYSTLMDNFRALMKKHDMPEDIAIELENFIVDVAKAQFKAGNKSGIAWMYQKMAEKQSAGLQAVAA